MATWANIPSTDTDAESPITESLMTQVVDNDVAMANGAAGTAEPPRIMCNASGDTAIAALGASAGDLLQVVNTANPNTGQGGLVVRPVAAFGDAKVSKNIGAGATATVNMTLTAVGSWLIKADGLSIANGVTQQIGEGSASARFINDSLSQNQSMVRPATGSATMAITRTGAGAIRVQFRGDAIANHFQHLIVSAIRYQ